MHATTKYNYMELMASKLLNINLARLKYMKNI